MRISDARAILAHESYIFYADFLTAIETLETPKQAQVIVAVNDFAFDCKKTEFADTEMKDVYTLITSRILQDYQKAEEFIQRYEARKQKGAKCGNHT